MSKTTKTEILRDMGDGLVLRRATISDTEQLTAFNAMIHSDEGPDKPDTRVAAWTRDLCEKPHPSYHVGDFTIVEDTRTGKIVSSLNLISQTWSYAGVEYGVGRPELVGTHPDYRNRGLVRAQFEIVHQWSSERGELVQAITGIPYYYRLFGYEMAANLDGGRAGYPTNVPRLKDDEQESCSIRPAEQADIPLMMELYERGTQRSLLACQREAAIWHYEMQEKSKDNVNRLDLFIIDSLEGQPLGFFGAPPFSWGDFQAVTVYEVKPGVSWAAVTPSVIRFLEKRYGEINDGHEGAKPFGAFCFWLGEDHPVYHILPSKLPYIRKPYAWYLRVPDLPAFMRKIAPVLEQRIEASYIPGYTGELRLTFYNGGLRLAFEKGTLSVAESYKPQPVGHEGEAGFPGLTFLQLLFGYRSLDELRSTYADCWAKMDDAYILLNTLFPKQPSNIWPVS